MRTLTVTIGLVLALAAPAGAAFSSAVTIGTNGSAFNPPPDVDASTAGDYVVAYDGGTVRAAVRPAGSATFSPALNVPGDKSSLAVAANGAAVVAWRASGTELKLAYRPSASVPFDTSLPAITGTNITALAAGIDDAGNAAIAYRDGSSLRLVRSTGATFGAPETAPSGIAGGFTGSDDTQLDTGPRAFRDNAGNVVLVHRSGNAAYFTRRAADGTWTQTALGPATDVRADADPASRRVFAAILNLGSLKAFEGATTADGMTQVFDQPANERYGVAVRPGGTETLVTYVRPGGDVMGASCRDAYIPAVAAGSSPQATSGAAAVTTGHDGIAAWSSTSGGTAPRAASRDPAGNWGAVATLENANLGGVAAGADGSGGALVAWVATSGAARGAFYTGSASVLTTQCAAVAGGIPPGVEPTPSATAVYPIPTSTPTPTATATAPPTDPCPAARKRLAAAQRALKKATKRAKQAAKALKRRKRAGKPLKQATAKVKQTKKAKAKAGKAVKKAKAAVKAAC